MKVEFEKEYLHELYYQGKTSSKKYRFQPDIIRRYRKAIDMLLLAQKVEDLFLFKGLNYEKLSGNKDGLESVRVNNQYRIEFKTTTETKNDNEVKTEITICSIVDLSNHYK